MALNLADRIAVRQNIVSRCTGAVVQFANYILGGGTVSGITTESALGWAREAIRSPSAVGDQISWYLVNKNEFIADGSGVSDSFIQGEVEAQVKAHLIQA